MEWAILELSVSQWELWAKIVHKLFLWLYWLKVPPTIIILRFFGISFIPKAKKAKKRLKFCKGFFITSKHVRNERFFVYFYPISWFCTPPIPYPSVPSRGQNSPKIKKNLDLLRIEPGTPRFGVHCSTNWANQALAEEVLKIWVYKYKSMKKISQFWYFFGRILGPGQKAPTHTA